MAHFFCIFHALSFELNFLRLEFPFKLMPSLIQQFTSKLEATLDFYVHKLMFLSSFHKLMV